MEAVVKERGASFVLLTGDNIYEDGVTSVDDPRFLDSFEYPYQNLDLPFYLCLGNHDCASTIMGGGSDNKRGNYQVDYHTAETGTQTNGTCRHASTTKCLASRLTASHLWSCLS